MFLLFVCVKNVFKDLRMILSYIHIDVLMLCDYFWFIMYSRLLVSPHLVASKDKKKYKTVNMKIEFFDGIHAISLFP